MQLRNISKSSQKSQGKKKTEVPLYRGPVTTLAVPAFQALTQIVLFRTNTKPPLEVVVANLEQGFPEGYIKYLMILHEEYPEWKFEAVITEINYEEFVAFQLSIQVKCADFDNDEKYCMASDFPGEVDPTYYDANREAVNYFMNPYSML